MLINCQKIHQNQIKIYHKIIKEKIKIEKMINGILTSGILYTANVESTLVDPREKWT